MITLQVEPWDAVCEEMADGLWPEHWAEIALDQEHIKLNVWHAAYERMDEAGELHIVTMRDDGFRIVGYHICIVRPHLHYQQSLSAYTDVYYVKPSHRKGLAAYRMFKYVEQSLKERGVERMFTATKIHMDMGRLFERMGWKETERLFTKYIGAE